MIICKRCIYDSSVPQIQFDSDGVCNFCRLIDNLKNEYQTGTLNGEKKFKKISNEIKSDLRGKKYDCIVGVSGGTDSSYILHLMIEYGHRPLAVHYDNTWNTSTATQNIRKITEKLNVDLYTHVVDNKEIDDIYMAFLLASVPGIDVATDLALAEVMYRVASKHNIKYVIEGHSFMTEGISPPGYSYFDGKYIEAIHKAFGSRPMVTFPNMKLFKFLYWVAFKRIKKIRPLWYINYSKTEAQKLLERKYGWEYYGGHHLENRITAFSHSYHNPIKFNMDQRNNSIAAMVRSGEMTRDEGIQLYSTPPDIDPNLISYTLKRLGISKKEFNQIIKSENKKWHDYPNDKKAFERLKPLFFVLAKSSLVPMSFYLKYCFPVKENT